MSLLDKIKIYNEIKEEEKKLLDERKFREKVISNLEEKLNLKIEYPGVKEIEKEMKEGVRVRIRRDSVFAHQNNGVGTVKVFRERFGVRVIFDDGYSNVYGKQDLEPAYTKEEIKQIEKENKEKLKEFYEQPFNLFKGYLKQQVEEIIETSKKSKEFKVGDKIILNKEDEIYGSIKEGSEGVIECILSPGAFGVKFTKIIGPEEFCPHRIVYSDHIGYLIPKKISEKEAYKLVQESINYAKKQ